MTFSAKRRPQLNNNNFLYLFAAVERWVEQGVECWTSEWLSIYDINFFNLKFNGSLLHINSKKFLTVREGTGNGSLISIYGWLKSFYVHQEIALLIPIFFLKLVHLSWEYMQNYKSFGRFVLCLQHIWTWRCQSIFQYGRNLISRTVSLFWSI